MTGIEVEELKKGAAVRSAEWIRDGMRLGLGTGSTIRHLVEHIGERRRGGDWRDIVAVPTSIQTERLAEAEGIPLTTLEDHPALDLTIDGADEVDPGLNLIKGLGGALLREKIVAAASEQLVIVVDDAKLVDRLGSRSPLPVEVDKFGASVHSGFFRSLGANPGLRSRPSGGIFTTDGGHLIYDCDFPDGIEDAESLEAKLQARPGIIETGLFLGMAEAVVVASASGVRVLERNGAYK